MKQRYRNKSGYAARQERASIRQAEHDKLSPEQKLAKLDQRLGKGVGALRERSKLLQQSVAVAAPALNEKRKKSRNKNS